MEEALTLEEQAVKRHNIEKGIEKPEKPIEKEIDGETWIKKTEIVVINETEIETQLKELFEKAKKGRNDKETVNMLRPIIKKLIYAMETDEVRGDRY